MYSTASLFGRRLNNGYRDLVTQLKGYFTEEQLSGVEAAYQFADSAHRGQLRASGDPYITHPVAVAGILAELHLDYPSIVAALLCVLPRCHAHGCGAVPINRRGGPGR